MPAPNQKPNLSLEEDNLYVECSRIYSLPGNLFQILLESKFSADDT